MPITTMRPALRQLKGRKNLIGAEIGVGDGHHASFFLSELDIDFVFLIDPYTAFKNLGATYSPEVIKKWEKNAYINLDKYKHKIKWIKGKSTNAVRFITDNSLDFVYIDGNHDYEFVVKDISLYYPKLKIGGLLSGHDYDYKSVKRAVDEFVNKENLKLYLEDMGPGQYAGKRFKADWWVWKK
jgi:hypothetical protein